MPNITADYFEDRQGVVAIEEPPQAGAQDTFHRNEHEPTPDGFDELMPKTLATATVDRLLHHAHVCQTSGDSIRLTQALAGKGVTPMS